MKIEDTHISYKLIPGLRNNLLKSYAKTNLNKYACVKFKYSYNNFIVKIVKLMAEYFELHNNMKHSL